MINKLKIIICDWNDSRRVYNQPKTAIAMNAMLQNGMLAHPETVIESLDETERLLFKIAKISISGGVSEMGMATKINNLSLTARIVVIPTFNSFEQKELFMKNKTEISKTE